MKTTRLLRLSVLALLLIQIAPAGAITFTGDTLIEPNNTAFEGLDIVVSNCTLTVDGSHQFASVQVSAGGIITHTFAANGSLPTPVYNVSGEALVLSSNAVSSLKGTNVNSATIVVRDSSSNVIYSNGVDYQILVQAADLTGLQLLPGSSIPEGSTNLVDYQYSGLSVPSGLTLTVSNNVVIEAGGSINVDGKGFGGGQGPGQGHGVGSPSSGGGAGHGGNGGQGAGLGGSGLVYDSAQQPTVKGSGGGAGSNGLGGPGGGAVKLVVGGALLVDGKISANGSTSVTDRSGGGSGGSIWLSAQTIAGSGSISANGGNGELPAGGGGGGGRISIQSGNNIFTGLTTAYGGKGYFYGGAGTIYNETGNQPGQLLVDNGGHQGLTTLLQGAEQSILTAQSGAVVSIPGSGSLAGLLVRSNASIMFSNAAASLTVSGNATIEPGGSITADGLGFPANQGRGPGRSSQTVVFVGGGGGYGGNGGGANGLNAWGGQGYGSYTAPVDAGSGGASSLGLAGIGPGSAGGGVIHLNVTGTLIVNGKISADGTAGVGDGSGGGSGGSVWINASTLAGAGAITANGGDGNGMGLYAGGGGGGGRIAIQSLNYFLGTLSAHGGDGYVRGGAGTVYLGDQRMPGQLVIDNGGAAGTNTLLNLISDGAADLTVSGAAVVSFSGQPSLHNLLVASNSWVSVSNTVISALGDVVIEPGGGILADGNGYGPSQGPGAGRYAPIGVNGLVGGGGGYGGFGGSASGATSTLATGGGTYGNVAGPTDRGSGGGASSTSAPGSTGGGAVRVIASGALRVNGLISANGTSGLTGGGGGSGGSIWLSAGIISGNGTISANGGDGSGNSGGGGGGRIAIVSGTNYFSGDMAAHGGDGNNRGGAGTIYTTSKNSSVGQLVIDNGGQAGTNTAWLSTGLIDLRVLGGATVAPPRSQALNSLLIGADSALLVSNGVQLSIRGDATIQAGGAITADGGGYGPGQGAGAGRSGDDARAGGSAGGGGYGGNGASGVGATAFGGSTYGSVTTPLELGSGGGGLGNLQIGSGGPGGGAIQMTVTGTLTLFGRISANGRDGQPGGGGGSGGSINITAGTLLGSGQISANGGMGDLRSGGGGGGRIALAVNEANSFNGSITAFGGDGYARGGAGTIFMRANSTSVRSQVLVDNGGKAGTNTPGISGGSFDLTIRGAAIASLLPQQIIYNLFVGTNSWLLLTNQPVTITGDAKVESGGGIIADGTGLLNGQGIGAGRSVNVPGYGYVGGGGGYGGYGANAGVAAPPVASGGQTYGSLTSPVDRGSSGGGYNLSYGGPGGGAIRLIISGTLELEGVLSARGLPGATPGAGGGSGGSIWLTTAALTGSGWITANGGSGNGYGGGGGGGRIALEYSINSFTGPITAFGGGGSSTGGAGTIYLKPKKQPVGRAIVDNGGQFGSHTTLGSLNLPYDLAIQGGAWVDSTNPSIVLSNLDIGWGGSLSILPSLKEMSVTILRDALVETGGAITLDGKGYASATGPGHGTTLNGVGSGGGYGGNGGGSSLQPGGLAYGSSLQPVDPGSGGGSGYGTATNGSEGGGALHLSVLGALTVNGSISANGNPGLQDDAGGGSGGSVWISTSIFAGTGQILAAGGEGELFEGGGGGGGRIALYSPANLFGGLISAAGGDGFASGQDGTIYYSSTLPPMSLVEQIPNSAVSYAVSNLDLSFSAAINPFTATGSGLTLMTPNGPLSDGQVLVTLTSAGTVRLSFTPQTVEGDYSVSLGSQIQGLYGETLSQPYTARFAISWPVIQGVVADAQNKPLSGVLLQPDGGLSPVQTDATGAYSLKVVPSGSVTIVPSCTNLAFVPGTRTYTNVSAPVAGQDYLGVTSIAPTASVRAQAGGTVMSWQTLPGVTYQAFSSTNLVDWVPYGAESQGTNGIDELTLPGADATQMFFRIRASY